MGIVNRITNQKGQEVKNIDLTENEIEFLLYIFGESMVPGKRLAEAVSIIEKLQNQYKEFQRDKIKE